MRPSVLYCECHGISLPSIPLGPILISTAPIHNLRQGNLYFQQRSVFTTKSGAREPFRPAFVIFPDRIVTKTPAQEGSLAQGLAFPGWVPRDGQTTRI